MNPFKSYRDSIIIKDHITAKHIIAGDYSYYSGYYHGKDFADCVMYLDAADNHHDPESIDRLIIGKFCSIATGVRFMMGGTQGHNYSWLATYPLDFLDDDFDSYQETRPKAQQSKGDTIIGHDVWIGAEAMIMPGIHIGDGAVIGARSLVTKNVGPYEIWGGNPARLLKKRFNDDVIEKLRRIKWWDWDFEILKRHYQLLRSQDIDTLWAKFEAGELPK